MVIYGHYKTTRRTKESSCGEHSPSFVHKQIQVDCVVTIKYLMPSECVEVSLRELFLPLGVKAVDWCFDRQHLNWLHGSALAHSKIAVFKAELPRREKTMLHYVDASK